MAWANPTSIGGANSNNAAATSLSVASVTVSAGRSLFIGIYGENLTGATFTITAGGNTFTKDEERLSATASASLWSAHNSAALSAATVTVAITGAGSNVDWGFLLWQADPGAGIHGAFDTGAAGTAGTLATPSSGASGTVAGGSELVFEFAMHKDTSGLATVNDTVGAPYTSLASNRFAKSLIPAAGWQGHLAYQNVASASGTYTGNQITDNNTTISASVALVAVYRLTQAFTDTLTTSVTPSTTVTDLHSIPVRTQVTPLTQAARVLAAARALQTSVAPTTQLSATGRAFSAALTSRVTPSTTAVAQQALLRDALQGVITALTPQTTVGFAYSAAVATSTTPATTVAMMRSTVEQLGSFVVPQTTLLTTSPASVANALAGLYGPVIIQYRLDWRDAGFRYLGDLTPALIDGSVSLDNDQPVARTCTLRLDAAGLPAGWISTSQAQFCVVIWADVLALGQYVSFSLGHFTIDEPQHTFSSSGLEIWEAQGADLTWFLASHDTGRQSYGAAAGANVVGVVQGIIDAQPSGLLRSIPPQAATLPTSITWGPRTTWLDICNDLLFGINYTKLFCTPYGVLTSRARLDPAADLAAVIYATTLEPRLVVEPFVRHQRSSSEDNVCTIAVDDPARTPPGAAAGTGLFSSTRSNRDPASPVSLVQDPRERTLDIRGGSSPSTKAVPDLAMANAIATQELRLAAARAQPATLLTLPDPRRTNRETVQLLIDTIERGSIWRVAKWTYAIPPSGGQGGHTPMTHELERAQFVTIT